jgi:hypothetical protein
MLVRMNERTGLTKDDVKEPVGSNYRLFGINFKINQINSRSGKTSVENRFSNFAGNLCVCYRSGGISVKMDKVNFSDGAKRG